MLWLIFTILLGLFAIGAAVFSTVPAARVGLPVLAGVVWVVMSFFMSLHTVGQRQVGIVYSLSGTVQGKKDPGVVFTAPWQHIKKEHVGLQRIDFDFGPDNSAVSQDQQDIYAHLAVNLSVEPNDVLHLYKTVGSAWKKIVLEPRVPQDFKAVTSTYLTTAITANREEIRKQTHDKLKIEMRRFGIDIEDVFLSNLDYAASYKRAIEAKQVQVQKSLAAKAKVDQIKYEAEQKVASAEGDAKANRLRQRSLTPLLIQQNAIDKLSDNVQIIYCSGDRCPAFLPSSLGK